MKRLLKSSNFWNAVIASIILMVCLKLGASETLGLAILGLFGLKTVASGVSDMIKDNQGIVYDPETNKEKRI